MTAPRKGRVKRRLAAIVAAGILLLSHGLLSVAYAQQADKLPRVGVLTNAPLTSAHYAAFRQALRDLGYVAGKNITLVPKSSQGNTDLFPELARELAGANVNVMVVAGEQGLRAAKDATGTIPIPIVAMMCDMPDHLMVSLARPGGKATGVTCMSTQLAGKRVQLLKELVPALVNIAVLYNPEDRTRESEYKQVQEAATSLGLTLRAYTIRSLTEIEKAFALMVEDHAQAAVIFPDVLTTSHQKQLAELTLKNRLPAIFGFREFVALGGLMSYGASLNGMWQRAALYADKILKGAEPDDRPIDQPTRFELVVNLKTAKTLGLPASLLVGADEVIE